MRWYRDAFCQYERGFPRRPARSIRPDERKKAKDIPAGCYGMMCAFSDVMNLHFLASCQPDVYQLRLDPEKFNRYTFYRAIMENTAMVTYGHMQLKSANPPATFRRKSCSPSGASKSELCARFSAMCWVFRSTFPASKKRRRGNRGGSWRRTMSQHFGNREEARPHRTPFLSRIWRTTQPI